MTSVPRKTPAGHAMAGPAVAWPTAGVCTPARPRVAPARGKTRGPTRYVPRTAQRPCCAAGAGWARAVRAAAPGRAITVPTISAVTIRKGARELCIDHSSTAMVGRPEGDTLVTSSTVHATLRPWEIHVNHMTIDELKHTSAPLLAHAYRRRHGRTRVPPAAQRQEDRERGAHALRAAHEQAAPVGPHDALGDRQPQAIPFGHRAGSLPPVEAGEQVRQFCRGDASPGVTHLQHGLLAGATQRHLHRATRAVVLDRIIQQDEEDLLQPRSVAQHHQWG